MTTPKTLSSAENVFPQSRQKARVSYIITTRNRADYLRQALESAREFVGSEDELILIDAASTDHTREVAEAFSDIVSVFESAPDRGEAHGFNKGLLLSSGRLIKPLTDDDLFDPDAMRESIRVLEDNPALDALVCGGEKRVVFPDGQTRFRNFVRLPEGLRFADDYRNALRHVNCGLGLWLRRETLGWAGLFATDFLAVDTEYMTRLIRLGANIRYLDVNLYRHWIHAESSGSSASRSHEIHRDYIRVHASFLKWDDLLTSYNGFIEPAHVRDVFQWPLSDDAMTLLWLGARLRQSRRGRFALWPARALIWTLARAWNGFRAARLALKRPRNKNNEPSISANPSLLLETPPEINWTGELR